ncbi:hypothetical protein MYCTH_2311488 [Thermothelomyces thermophilus ATCC 42464]|uniref:Uncharacterized protein n=1 Tax=Thermothelomyces thermophilus (strain ATCC 42464 / BCRC 31852 / DSM 1799) TaxID=573729 RepID=G2QP73_THET4|nr:uncharacterized protein MYCTH_2311488 [Thermothelomyces thermophilus ATCC 42464]AEO61386.1 hypothetical protein MYCTH_2311488 [Thermothelomyces thermophilus ATCC 42464]
MPPLFDEAQIHNALRNEALPELARLAGDQRLRERALDRFDRDEPPPYLSSTDDEEYLENELPLGSDGSGVLQEFVDLMKQPLTDAERDTVAMDLHFSGKVYQPGHRYHQEAVIEAQRIRRVCRELRPANAEAQKFLDFQGRAGDERLNILVRRNIKRRWRKLGVWNPQWGIPGRRNGTNPDDDASKWKWRWQHGDAAAEWTPSATATAANPKHPITRALALRQGLLHGEHAPVPPRSRLPDDASASQAESFIISRPWFVFMAEYFEERERFYRIPPMKRRHYREPIAKPVIERWKSRGDWRDEWDQPVEGAYVPGWKWRHESPSPEPEDLTPLETMDLEFTPSEVDALEAIRPPTPPPPPPPRSHSPRHFPSGDQTVHSGTGLFSSHPLPRAPPTPPAADDSAPEVPEPAQAAPQQQQQQPRRRPRQRKDEQPVQPVRRSARIAAMNKTKANPPPPPAPAPPPQARQSRQRAARAPVGEQPAGRPKTDRSTRAQRRAAASDKPSARSMQAEKPTTARSRGRPKKKTGRR